MFYDIQFEEEMEHGRYDLPYDVSPYGPVASFAEAMKIAGGDPVGDPEFYAAEEAWQEAMEAERALAEDVPQVVPILEPQDPDDEIPF